MRLSFIHLFLFTFLKKTNEISVNRYESTINKEANEDTIGIFYNEFITYKRQIISKLRHLCNDPQSLFEDINAFIEESSSFLGETGKEIVKNGVHEIKKVSEDILKSIINVLLQDPHSLNLPFLLNRLMDRYNVVIVDVTNGITILNRLNESKERALELESIFLAYGYFISKEIEDCFE